MQVNFFPQVIYSYKQQRVRSTYTPRFGMEQPDSFSRTVQTNPDRQNTTDELAAILNVNRNAHNKIEFPHDTLDAIEKTVINNEAPNNYALNIIGYQAQKLALRKFLIKHLPYSNSFFYSMHAHGMRTLLKSGILDDDKASTNNNSNEKQHIKQKLQDNFPKLFGTMYLKGSSDLVYNFMEPHLVQAFTNSNPTKLFDMLRWFYKNDNRDYKTYSYGVKKIDEKYYASDYLDGEVLDNATGCTEDEATISLFSKRLESLNLKAEDTLLCDAEPTYNKYYLYRTASKRVETLLKETGFLSKDEKINAKCDAEKIHYLVNALSWVHNTDKAYKFDSLEYYGDAVLNLLTAKFLHEQRFSDKKFRHYFPKMISNSNITKYTFTLGLPNYTIDNPENENISNKRYADLFEAYIGALHLSYPEERLYNYLKPLFVSMLDEIKEEDELFRINFIDRDKS